MQESLQFESIMDIAQIDQKSRDTLKSEISVIDPIKTINEEGKFPYLQTPAGQLAAEGKIDAAKWLIRQGASLGPILFSSALINVDLSRFSEFHFDDRTKLMFELLADIYCNDELIPSGKFLEDEILSFEFDYKAENRREDNKGYPRIHKCEIKVSDLQNMSINDRKIHAFINLIHLLAKLEDRIVDVYINQRKKLLPFFAKDRMRTSYEPLMACTILSGAVMGGNLAYVAKLLTQDLKPCWKYLGSSIWAGVYWIRTPIHWLYRSGLIEHFYQKDSEGLTSIDFVQLLQLLSPLCESGYTGKMFVKIARDISRYIISNRVSRLSYRHYKDYPFLFDYYPEKDFFTNAGAMYELLTHLPMRLYLQSKKMSIEPCDFVAFQLLGGKLLADLTNNGLLKNRLIKLQYNDSQLKIPLDLFKTILTYSGHLVGIQTQAKQAKIDPLESARQIMAGLHLNNLVKYLNDFTTTNVLKSKTSLQMRADKLLEEIFNIRERYKEKPYAALQDHILDLLDKTIAALTEHDLPEKKHEQAVLNNIHDEFYRIVEKTVYDINKIKTNRLVSIENEVSSEAEIENIITQLIASLYNYINSWSPTYRHKERARSFQKEVQCLSEGKKFDKAQKVVIQQLSLFKLPWQAPRDARDELKQIENLSQGLENIRCGFNDLP